MFLINHIAEIVIIINVLISMMLYSLNAKNYKFIYVTLLAIVAEILCKYNFGEYQSMDVFTFACRQLLLITFLGLIVSHKIQTFGDNILFLLSLVGSLICVSINDVFSLFLAIELGTLPLYIAVYKNRNSSLPKYLMFGTASASVEIFAISLIYMSTGTTNFFEISNAINTHSSGLQMLGTFVLILAFFIKLAFIPFHSWLPETMSSYKHESVQSFIIIISKVSLLMAFIRLVCYAFGDVDITCIINLFVGASVLLASISAIKTQNLKLLCAYISIEHTAYIICGLTTISTISLGGMLFFITSELLAFSGVFAALYNMKYNVSKEVSNISNLRGLSRCNLMFAISLTCLLVSLAGIPPLLGFWGKYYVLLSLANGKNYVLLVTCIISTVMSGIYTINVIKNIWTPAEQVFKIENRSMIVHILSLASVVLPLVNRHVFLIVDSIFR